MSLHPDRDEPARTSSSATTVPRGVSVVVLASDALARAGLVALCSMAGLTVVLARTSVGAHGALFAELARPPEVVLYDLGPAAPHAIDFTGLSAAPIVALVGHETEARGALAAGARGVLARGVGDPRALASALTAVAHGLFVSAYPMVTAATGTPRARSNGNRGAGGGAGEGAVDELTARELEVLHGLTEGLSNKGLAARLFISEHTVKTHVNAILAKLGAESRTDAVVRAARLGLVLL